MVEKGKKRKRDEKMGPSKKRKVDPKSKLKVAINKKLGDGVAELKYIDTENIIFGILSTPTITHLSNIDQGFEAVDRVGSTVYMKKIHIKYFLNASQNNVQAIQQIRVILFMDRQQVASTSPTASQLLESTSVVGTINYQNKKRWKILMDKYHSLSMPSQLTTNYQHTTEINEEVNWSGNLGTSILRNGVYIMLLSDNASGVQADAPVIRYRARLTYTDK